MKVCDGNHSKLPMLQTLQLFRINAVLLFKEKQYKSSLNLLYKIKEEWGALANGNIHFHPDIPYSINLIELAETKLEISRMKEQLNNRSDERGLIQRLFKNAVNTQTLMTTQQARPGFHSITAPLNKVLAYDHMRLTK